MSKCDNCKTEFDDSKEGFVVSTRGRVAASVCGGCCQGARKVKLVLTRGDLGGFTYEQFSAIEMARAAG